MPGCRKGANKGPVILAAAIALTVLPACRAARNSTLTARASNQWTRTYPLEQRGELEIGNTNGTIDIAGAVGMSVDVVAERIAKALTEKAAGDLLPHITISEDVMPDHVTLQTERVEGLLIGADVEVNYRVKVPFDAMVRVRNVNGRVVLTSLTGRVSVNGTNGEIVGTSLSGGVEVRTRNGSVRVDLSALGTDPVDFRTTNGAIELSLPRDAGGTLLATLTNGSIELDGLNFEPLGEQSQRRIRGRLNSGGTTVELATVNGAIQIRARD